jgi:hypothetical protein
MGDAIDKLPLDEILDYSQRDVSNLKRFFDTTVSKKEVTEEKSRNVYMFVGLITLLYFICNHPSGPSRFFPERYRLIGSSILFGIILFLYLYFNK